MEGAWTPTLTFNVEPTDYSATGTYIKQQLDALKWIVTLNYRFLITDYGTATGESFTVGGLPFVSLGTRYCEINHTDSSPGGYTQVSNDINGVLDDGDGSISFNGGSLSSFSSGDLWSGSLTYVCL